MNTHQHETLSHHGSGFSPDAISQPIEAKLALTNAIRERETLQSYVSRLARRNHLDHAPDFCRLVDLRWMSLVNGDLEAIGSLSELCGIEAARLAKYAVKLDSHHVYRVNGQFLSSEIAKRYDQRICPACIEADVRYDRLCAYGRAEWQVESFRTCPIHKCQLVTLPRANYPRSPYDFAGRLFDQQAWLSKVVSIKADDDADHPVENYILERLTGVKSDRWIDQLGLDVAIKLLRTVGATLQFGSDTRLSKLGDDELAECEKLAFDAMGKTLKDFYGVLEEIAWSSKTGRRNFHKDFGPISTWLSKVDHLDLRLSPLLTAISDFSFAHYPISIEKSVFGRKRSSR
ncbi:MAG: TniQ family protein, partial [Pseudomonadota bacterium]